MGALKALVAIMGVLIVGGVAVLAATIAGRLSGGSEPARPFSAPAIAVPPGARVEAMTAGPERLVVDLALADGTRELLVIDLASGRKLGTIPLGPGP